MISILLFILTIYGGNIRLTNPNPALPSRMVRDSTRRLGGRTGEHSEIFRNFLGSAPKSMVSLLKKSYILGDYRLETDKQLLSRNGLPVHLPKRPFNVLLYLI